MFSSMMLCFQVYWNTECVRWRVLSMLILNIWLSVFLHTDTHTYTCACTHTQKYTHTKYQIISSFMTFVCLLLLVWLAKIRDLITSSQQTGPDCWLGIHSDKLCAGNFIASNNSECRYSMKCETLLQDWLLWTPFTCVCEGKCTARQS